MRLAYRLRARRSPLALRPILAGLLLAFFLVLQPAPSRAETCSGDPPCISHITETKRGNQIFLTLHWIGDCKFGHYNLRGVPQGTGQLGQNRGQLCNRRSHTFDWPARRGVQYAFSIQGCVEYVIGSDRCVPRNFSTPVTIVVGAAEDAANAKNEAECRQYAQAAIDMRRFARYGRCSAAALSGPRWSPRFDDHMRWCRTASPQARQAETLARRQEFDRCRAEARKPNITVTQSRGGDDYFLNGTGFAANAPVTIRVGGPAAGTVNITVVNRQRILANASGAISVRLFGAMFCKRGGDITFAAQDGDGPLSNVVNSKCNP